MASQAEGDVHDCLSKLFLDVDAIQTGRMNNDQLLLENLGMNQSSRCRIWCKMRTNLFTTKPSKRLSPLRPPQPWNCARISSFRTLTSEYDLLLFSTLLQISSRQTVLPLFAFSFPCFPGLLRCNSHFLNSSVLFGVLSSEEETRDLGVLQRIRSLHWVRAHHLDVDIDDIHPTVKEYMDEASTQLIFIDSKRSPR